jgi:hypothetical protein
MTKPHECEESRARAGCLKLAVLAHNLRESVFNLGYMPQDLRVI